MDLYDSLEKLTKEDNQNSYKKYKTAAKNYIYQGFDQEMISELLQIDGCPRDISHKLASDISNEMPLLYEEGPPISYEDVKTQVEKTILNTPLEDLEEYFRSHAAKYLETLKRIAAVRVCPTQIMINELHKELEPLVENIILSNRVSIESGNLQKTSSKEYIEQKLFGTWSIEDLYNYNKKINSEKEIVKKTSKKSERPNIIF
jgi:hypothetical protein